MSRNWGIPCPGYPCGLNVCDRSGRCVKQAQDDWEADQARCKDIEELRRLLARVRLLWFAGEITLNTKDAADHLDAIRKALGDPETWPDAELHEAPEKGLTQDANPPSSTEEISETK